METAHGIGITLLDIFGTIIMVYSYTIFANIILSWVLPPTHTVKQFLNFITEPVVAPVRRILQPLMDKLPVPIDFSALITYLLLQLSVPLMWEIVALVNKSGF